MPRVDSIESCPITLEALSRKNFKDATLVIVESYAHLTAYPVIGKEVWRGFTSSELTDCPFTRWHGEYKFLTIEKLLEPVASKLFNWLFNEEEITNETVPSSEASQATSIETETVCMTPLASLLTDPEGDFAANLEVGNFTTVQTSSATLLDFTATTTATSQVRSVSPLRTVAAADSSDPMRHHFSQSLMEGIRRRDRLRRVNEFNSLLANNLREQRMVSLESRGLSDFFIHQLQARRMALRGPESEYNETDVQSDNEDNSDSESSEVTAQTTSLSNSRARAATPLLFSDLSATVNQMFASGLYTRYTDHNLHSEGLDPEISDSEWEVAAP